MYTYKINKLGLEYYTRDLRFKIKDNPQTPSETPQTEIRVYSARKIHMVGWVGGFFQEIITLRGSILQVGTCQILSLAENPRWNPSVAISQEYLRQISGIFYAHPRHISDKSQTNLMRASGISQANLRHIWRYISDISQAYLMQISGLSQAYLKQI